MTKRQKQQKIADIKSLLTSSGFTLDRWGNYSTQLNDKQYRIKIKPINLRAEYKINSTWYKSFSKPIASLEMAFLTSYLIPFMQAKQAGSISKPTQAKKKIKPKQYIRQSMIINIKWNRWDGMRILSSFFYNTDSFERSKLDAIKKLELEGFDSTQDTIKEVTNEIIESGTKLSERAY